MPTIRLLALLAFASAGAAAAVETDPRSPLEIVRAFDAAVEARDAAAMDALWLRGEGQAEDRRREWSEGLRGRGDAFREIRDEHRDGDAAVVTVVDADGDVGLAHVVRTPAGWLMTPYLRNGNGLGAESERLAGSFATLHGWYRITLQQVAAERDAALTPEQLAERDRERAEATAMATAVLAWARGEATQEAPPIATVADFMWLLEHHEAARTMARDRDITPEKIAAERQLAIDKGLATMRERLAEAGIEPATPVREVTVSSVRDQPLPLRRVTASFTHPDGGLLLHHLTIEAMVLDGRLRVMPGGIRVGEWAPLPEPRIEAVAP